MDCLIDFNSPKLRREDIPLIPGSFLGSMPNPFSVTGEESNPFDMVVCQVAANAAAEDDPFEMVLHNAINSHEITETTDVKNSPVVSKLCQEKLKKSISLPDMSSITREENLGAQETENIRTLRVKPEQVTQEIVQSARVVFRDDSSQNDSTENNDAAEWNYLEDIPPPDSLLNSTVDMSCFLDETLSASNSSKPKHHLESIVSPENQHIFSNSLSSQEPLAASVKSETEVILLAQKKIENIITKATLAVNNDIQDSIIQRRISSQLLTPYQEALGLCTPKRSKDMHFRSSIEPSLSVEEWSSNEMRKLNIALPEPSSKSSVGQDFMCDFDKICNSFLRDKANISSEEMPIEDLSFSSPLKQITPPKQKDKKSVPSGPEPQKKTPDLSSSPALLPLPLSEDAVRNLSLCSKYSPTRVSTHQNISSLGDTQSVKTSSHLEQNVKQTKLFLRKPAVPSKNSSKMAPMKATAPVQNMTRIKSSLGTSSKLDLKNTIGCAARKSISKMPQSPRCAMSGSLPNLSGHVTKAPSRLPSPRRSVALVQEPLNMAKRQTENRKEKSTPQISTPTSAFHSSPRPSSPRPIRKGSLYNRSGRVLADVNTSSSSRMTPKSKNNQSDTPRRGRSVVTEKENYL